MELMILKNTLVTNWLIWFIFLIIVFSLQSLLQTCSQLLILIISMLTHTTLWEIQFLSKSHRIVAAGGDISLLTHLFRYIIIYYIIYILFSCRDKNDWSDDANQVFQSPDCTPMSADKQNNIGKFLGTYVSFQVILLWDSFALKRISIYLYNMIFKK